jgi:hypothetical protein
MRSLTALALALAAPAILLSPLAHAAARGTIRGRVVDGITGEPRAGARLRLQGYEENGSGRVSETAVSDRAGRFAFSGLATGAGRFYVVDAYFEGGLFAGRAVQLPDDTTRPPEIEATIRVWETTTDPTVVSIARDDLFLIPSEGGVAAVESIVFENSSDAAYIGRGARRGAPNETPSIGFALPAGAEDVQIIDADLDVPRLVPAEFGFAATVALPPGSTKITFSYRLPEVAAQHVLSRTALYGTDELSVHTKPPLTLETDRLQQGEDESIEGTTYRVWTSDEPIDPGDSVQLLALAEGGRPAALFAGVGAFVALVLAATAVMWRRARKTPRPAKRAAPTRDAVVTAIARLDLDYQEGELTHAAWERERARLKDQLDHREPTP